MAYPTQSKKLGEKAKQPHQGIPLLPLNKDAIAKLITKHTGNLSRIADSLGTTRNTLRVNIEKDPELKQLLADSRERWIDDVEESVLSRASEGTDTALQCFVLKTQGRNRGWEQDESKNTAKDIATAAFDFILNKSKNPAEPSQ